MTEPLKKKEKKTVWEGQLELQLVRQWHSYKKKTAYALKELKEYRFPIYAYFIRKKPSNTSKTKGQDTVIKKKTLQISGGEVGRKSIYREQEENREMEGGLGREK